MQRLLFCLDTAPSGGSRTCAACGGRSRDCAVSASMGMSCIMSGIAGSPVACLAACCAELGCSMPAACQAGCADTWLPSGRDGARSCAGARGAGAARLLAVPPAQPYQHGSEGCQAVPAATTVLCTPDAAPVGLGSKGMQNMCAPKVRQVLGGAALTSHGRHGLPGARGQTLGALGCSR